MRKLLSPSLVLKKAATSTLIFYVSQVRGWAKYVNGKFESLVISRPSIGTSLGS